MTDQPDNVISQGFNARAEYFPDANDEKPWAAVPIGSTYEDAIKIAWGRTADEALAQYGALYHNIERKHTFLGKTDMINWDAIK